MLVFSEIYPNEMAESILAQIHGPSDLRSLKPADLDALAQEIR
jgi:deoxyxylulose-5-phosphate synthase